MTFKRFSLGLRFLMQDAEGFSPADAWNLLFSCLSPGEVKGMELYGVHQQERNGQCYICVFSRASLSRCRMLYARLSAHPLICSHLLFYRPFLQNNRLEQLTGYEYLGVVGDNGDVQYGEASYGTMRFCGDNTPLDPLLEPAVFLIAPDAYCGLLTPEQSIRCLMRVAYEYFPLAQIIPFPLADGGRGTTDALLHALGGRYVGTEVTAADGGRMEVEYGILPDRTIVIEAESVQTAQQLLCETLDIGYTSFIVGLYGEAACSEREPFQLPLHPRIGNVQIRIIDSGSGSAFFLDRAGFDARIREVSVVVTGDGYPDSAHHDAVREIRRRCAEGNVPVVVFDGEEPPPATADEALQRLRAGAARIFRLLHTGGRLQHR
jgi:hypothetical protein